MTPVARPTLVVIAGPNGAGKSTLYQTRVAPHLSLPFINADDIQRDDLRDSSPAAAYEAARMAARRRRDHIAARRGFVMETVFSHASKLEEMADALEAGFRVLVLHVGVDSADLSMARVAGRVQEGGHAVPEEKVRDRFVRNGPLIRRAVLLANVGKVFDNSGVNRPPIPVLEFRSGILRFVTPFVPRWVRNIYGRELGHITD